MQAPQGSQRSMQRTSPAGEMGRGSSTQPSSTGSVSSVQGAAGVRSTSGSGQSPTSRRSTQQPGQQLSQIEKSVTHLLVATKQLLETLTQWSRHTSTEAEVSDVYVRLGYEFNIACRAFNAIGVETTDLGPVPDLLRAILEDTLSQEASPQSLDRFLPRIRDIIINLLHGLKRKQQRLRQKQQREGGSGSNGLSSSRQTSGTSTASVDSGLTQMLDDATPHHTSSRPSAARHGSKDSSAMEEQGVPPRTSSVPGGRSSPVRHDAMSSSSTSGRTQFSKRDTQQSLNSSTSSSSMSSNTMQNIPVLAPYPDEEAISRHPFPPPHDTASFPPPPPPPKQQDALAALQRGGDLERRASRRYSAYQISKHLGAPPNGVPMLPPTQNSPIPNRGRDVRESMNAVRVRGSQLHGRQKSANRLAVDVSPSRGNTVSRKISEESNQSTSIQNDTPTIRPPDQFQPDDSPLARTPEDKLRQSFLELDTNGKPTVGATLNGPLGAGVEELRGYNGGSEGDEQQPIHRTPEDIVNAEGTHATTHTEGHINVTSSPPHSHQFVPEQSPQPGKDLILFLQYKSKIKKCVLPDGYNDLTTARLQLAFIEKFAWNTHSNGNDLPEIYIQDPVSGVRHELEDLSDVKDRSVLVLNVEVLDEVKRQIDEGLSGLRTMVEGVRTVLDGQRDTIQRVSDRQQDAAKNMARLAASSSSTGSATKVSRKISLIDGSIPNGVRASTPPVDSTSQAGEVQGLRRDLAVVRQTMSSFTSDIETSMSSMREKASNIKTVAIKTLVPSLEGGSGRAYVNAGTKTLGEDSEKIVDRVDSLQDIVEDLRKDVVTRGVRPLPRQLDTVSKDISMATAELKKLQEYLKREKPIWTKIWEKELELVCTDRDLLTMQEELAADLEDDLDKATQTFALVEQATKQQMQQTGQGVVPRSTSKGLSAIATNQDVDPVKAQDGVLGEVRALQPNHETRLEAIERAERARQKELEDRRGGEFQQELGNFVEEGKLKKSGGVEEAERMRTAKDERIRKEVWERQQERAIAKVRESENTVPSNSPETPEVPNEGATDQKTVSPEPESLEAKEDSADGGEHFFQSNLLANYTDRDSQNRRALPGYQPCHGVEA
ncbi:MAG: Bud site selection protein 6 [Pycnora praestabilis]|nr:MAG: Bud site selection protein 6 [Pycnora praestabilis]